MKLKPKIKAALIAAAVAALAVYGYTVEPDVLMEALSLVGL